MTQYYTVRKGGVSRDSDMDPTDIDAELEEILEGAHASPLRQTGAAERDCKLSEGPRHARRGGNATEPVKTKAKFVAQLAADQREFRPVGEKVAEYRLEAPKPSGPKAPKLADDNVVYEIYRVSNPSRSSCPPASRRR